MIFHSNTFEIGYYHLQMFSVHRLNIIGFLPIALPAVFKGLFGFGVNAVIMEDVEDLHPSSLLGKL